MESKIGEDFTAGTTNRTTFIGIENGPQENTSSSLMTDPHVVTLFPSKLERQYSEDMKNFKRNGFFEILRQLIIVALLMAIFCGFLFESKVNYDR